MQLHIQVLLMVDSCVAKKELNHCLNKLLQITKLGLSNYL